MGMIVFPETSVTNYESMVIRRSYEDFIYTMAEPEVTQVFV
jgi:carbamoylphosphate synthase small subunit